MGARGETENSIELLMCILYAEMLLSKYNDLYVSNIWLYFSSAVKFYFYPNQCLGEIDILMFFESQYLQSKVAERSLCKSSEIYLICIIVFFGRCIIFYFIYVPTPNLSNIGVLFLNHYIIVSIKDGSLTPLCD